MKRAVALSAAFVVPVLLAACGGGTDAGDATDAIGQDAPVDVIVNDVINDQAEDEGRADIPGDATLPDADPWKENPNLLGTFSVIEQTSIYEEETHRGASAWGGFLLTPMPEYLTEAASEGACTLYLYDPDRCPGDDGNGCVYDGVCALDGTCVSWPEHGTVGTITLSGLTGVADQEIQPQFGSYYSATFPYPPPTDIFGSASTISITAPGDTLPAINLSAQGVDDLVVDEAAYLNVPMENDDTILRWVRGKTGDRIHLTIPSVNECHGCPPLGKIVCDAPDTGALMVPGSLLSRLPHVMAGICVGIDCPNATLERYRSSIATVAAGDIELRVTSTVSFRVEHAQPVDAPVAFQVMAVESRGQGSAQSGWVAVMNPPSEEMVQEVKAEVDGCRFLEPAETGVCETFCTWPGYCGADNQCHEGLERRTAGKITFEGLLATCSAPLQGLDLTYPYYVGECDPSYPEELFDPGATITVTAAGDDDMPGFSLQAPGVERIETTLPCETFSLEAGKPLTVTWTPGGQAGDRIRFYLRSANHGGQFGHIDCDVPDTGSLTVDASLIDMHLAAFNPAPSWRLERVHETRSVVDGTGVAFEVRSDTGCSYGY